MAQGVAPIKQEQFAPATLGLLQREIILPGLVWRDAGGSFKGSKNDTISLRVPAIPGNARTITLRTEETADAPTSARQRVLDNLAETKVDLTLTKDIYKGVRLSDEMLTLDISDFGSQVLQPIATSVAYAIDGLVATTITGATYATGMSGTYASDEDLFPKILGARQALNKRNVPQERIVLVGASAETKLLASDRLSFVDNSGSDAALRRAEIGRLAGMPVVTSLALPENDIYVFHRTAFVLSLQAPEVPAGAAFGTTISSNGLAFRFVRDYDPLYMFDRAIVDVFAGANVVTDDLGLGNGTKGLIRAYKLTLDDES